MRRRSVHPLSVSRNGSTSHSGVTIHMSETDVDEQEVELLSCILLSAVLNGAQGTRQSRVRLPVYRPDAQRIPGATILISANAIGGRPQSILDPYS